MLYIVWYDRSLFKAKHFRHFPGHKNKRIISCSLKKTHLNAGLTKNQQTWSHKHDDIWGRGMNDLKHLRCGCDSVQQDSAVSAVHSCVFKLFCWSMKDCAYSLCTGFVLTLTVMPICNIPSNFTLSAHLFRGTSPHTICFILLLQFCILIRDYMNPQPEYTVYT